MNVEQLLKKRNTIYGICALWIIFFHLYRQLACPNIPIVTNFLCIGNMGVDVFFFLSGLCLSLSAVKHKYSVVGWKAYFKRRLSRVLIPYLCVGIPYYLWSAFFERTGSLPHRLLRFLADLSSATFWLRGMSTTWYVFGIIIFYLLFPLLFTIVSSTGRKQLAFLITGMACFAVLSAYLPVIKNSIVLWSRLPVFTLGIILGTRDRTSYALSRSTRICLLVVLLLLFWLTSSMALTNTQNKVFIVCRLLLFAPMTVLLLTLVSDFGNGLRFFELLGTISLEIYLVHITILHPLAYWGYVERFNNRLYLILPFVSVAIAWLVKQLSDITRRIIHL